MVIGTPVAHRKARIEIIPLIDIMFFLLASFMMVSLSQVHVKGMKVNLPLGQSGETQSKKNYISVSVDKDGHPFFDKEEVSYDELFRRLQQIHQADPDAKVFVRGDVDTVHGNIIRVLDLLRAAGFSKIAFEIKSLSLKNIAGPR
jgi:biopolymer transport protein ExbD